MRTGRRRSLLGIQKGVVDDFDNPLFRHEAVRDHQRQRLQGEIKPGDSHAVVPIAFGKFGIGHKDSVGWGWHEHQPYECAAESVNADSVALQTGARMTAAAARIPFEAITTDSVTQGYGNALEQAVGTLRSHLKIVARETGGNVEAIKNHLARRNAPNLTQFFRACRKFPEVRAWGLAMMGAEADLDPNFEREVLGMLSTLLRRKPELLARIVTEVPDADPEPALPLGAAGGR